MNKILKKIAVISIIFFSYSLNAEEIEKRIFLISNNSYTTIDFQERILYLKLLTNENINLSNKEIKKDFISVLLFNEFSKKNNIEFSNEILIDYSNKIISTYKKKFPKKFNNIINNLNNYEEIIKKNVKYDYQRKIVIEQKLNNKNIENYRTDLLQKMNFISPYIELPKKLTIEENLTVYGRMYGVKDLKDKIIELMDKLNLTEFKKRKTGELSSGQKNRVSLAKALINDPEIILLDEPTASLDPDVGDYVRGIIENFSSNNEKTILIASHNMNEVERLCEEVMMMKNGEIIDKGKSLDLINKHGRKNLEEVFLKIVREEN